MDLSKHIHALRDQWLTGCLAQSYVEFTSGAARGGNCNDFARELVDVLEEAGVENVCDFELANFQVEEPGALFEQAGRPLDRQLLSTHWPKVQPTQGLGWDDLERLAEDAGWDTGTHAWVVHEQRHYDCECPQGVDNFLELPFFERAIASWKEEKQATPARVARRPGP